MRNFYFYSRLDGESQPIAEELLKSFVKDGIFNPHTTKYSGIMIKANDATEALETFSGHGPGEIVLADEPAVTAELRLKTVSSNVEADLREASEQLVILRENANELISIMSRVVLSQSKNDNIGAKHIYAVLKQVYIEQLRKMEFKIGPSD